MAITHVSGFNVSMKGKMYLFKATIKLNIPGNKAVEEEDVVIAITGGSVSRVGIIKALTNRCNEIKARKESRVKHAQFASWLLNYSTTIAFKQNIAQARRKEKESSGLIVV